MFKLHPELKKDIGAEACGQVANSFDLSEM